MSPTTIFSPVSSPAAAIFELSILVVGAATVIFLSVGSLLVYAVVTFRRRPGDDGGEPAQVYGSTQVEIAWTVVPILIVVVLFLASARVIVGVQLARQPAGSIEVTAVGHQFWWEYRYPALGVVTANELHMPVSDAAQAAPTFFTLLSADTDHSFWVPRLGWPVVQPWPSTARWPRWSVPAYLFLATLPCDGLSAFLAFSDRVVYPAYFSEPRLFGISVIQDQEWAGATMWLWATVAYTIPAVVITTTILSSAGPHAGRRGQRPAYQS